MEPITLFALASVASFSWLLNAYGKKIIGEISSRFRYIFEKRNILIFGPKGAGKTSLLWYLKDGQPFKVKGGEIVKPNPTGNVVVIGRNVQLSQHMKRPQAQYANVPADVGGDQIYRDAWKDLTTEIDPDGIIYMVNGSLTGDEFKESVEDLFEDVLSVYKNRRGRLNAVHVFLNFGDIWARNLRVQKDKEHAVENYILSQLGEYKFLKGLRIGVSTTQLSPERNEWESTGRALHRFASDFV